MWLRTTIFLFLFLALAGTACHRGKVEQTPTEIARDYDKLNKKMKRSNKKQMRQGKRERAKKGRHWKNGGRYD